MKVTLSCSPAPAGRHCCASLFGLCCCGRWAATVTNPRRVCCAAVQTCPRTSTPHCCGPRYMSVLPPVPLLLATATSPVSVTKLYVRSCGARTARPAGTWVGAHTREQHSLPQGLMRAHVPSVILHPPTAERIQVDRPVRPLAPCLGTQHCPARPCQCMLPPLLTKQRRQHLPPSIRCLLCAQLPPSLWAHPPSLLPHSTPNPPPTHPPPPPHTHPTL